jgi:HK97 family phage major capsid protein
MDPEEIRKLTYSQIPPRLRAIEARLVGLSSKHRLSKSDDAERDALSGEAIAINEHRLRLERADDLAKGRGRGRYQLEGEGDGIGARSGDDYDRDSLTEPDSAEDQRRYRNPWDLSEVRMYGRDPGEVSAELHARALSAIEKMPVANDRIRSAATHIIERFDSRDSKLARLCLVTSKPAYVRAWSKLARNEAHTLTVDEQRALADVQEFRAMSLTDSAGGFLIPFQLDSTLIITSRGVRSDIRQVARQVVATTDIWHGVSSSNVSWSFDPEGTEVSDDSTVFAQPTIPNYMARGFVPISIEAMADEANVAQDVGMQLASGKLQLEGEKFILGSGTGEPTGIVTALTAAGGSVITPSLTAATFALGDVFNLQSSLAARYRAAASWLGSNSTYNKIRQFDQARGGGFWSDLTGDRPAQLLMRDALEAEAMVTTTTSGSQTLIFGDFEQYVICDRLGMAVEFVPLLFGPSQRPTGQRGWFSYYRVGAGVTNADAFRILQIS